MGQDKEVVGWVEGTKVVIELMVVVGMDSVAKFEDIATEKMKGMVAGTQKIEDLVVEYIVEKRYKNIFVEKEVIVSINVDKKAYSPNQSPSASASRVEYNFAWDVQVYVGAKVVQDTKVQMATRSMYLVHMEF